MISSYPPFIRIALLFNRLRSSSPACSPFFHLHLLPFLLASTYIFFYLDTFKYLSSVRLAFFSFFLIFSIPILPHCPRFLFRFTLFYLFRSNFYLCFFFLLLLIFCLHHLFSLSLRYFIVRYLLSSPSYSSEIRLDFFTFSMFPFQPNFLNITFYPMTIILLSFLVHASPFFHLSFFPSTPFAFLSSCSIFLHFVRHTFSMFYFASFCPTNSKCAFAHFLFLVFFISINFFLHLPNNSLYHY